MVFAGDMSGYFAIFDIKNNKILMGNQHDAAVTTKCLIHCGMAIYCKFFWITQNLSLGTVDGQVHCVNLVDFKTNSLVVGSSIRANPCVFDDTRIFIPTFSTHLVLLNLSTLLVENVCDLSSGPIRNPPLVVNNFIVVSTIDGVLAGFRKKLVNFGGILKIIFSH